jgi:hypothetical protein
MDCQGKEKIKNWIASLGWSKFLFQQFPPKAAEATT